VARALRRQALTRDRRPSVAARPRGLVAAP
jgi:hypothetical protein